MEDLLARHGVERLVAVRDASSGLFAVIVLDDVTLGPAAGGVRTRAYASVEDGIADAARLARAMTVKCALAGLAAGGGKAVVFDRPGLDRPRAFAVLGERIAELGGLFRTAGDLGTTAADLAAMATTCRWVHTDEPHLAAAVARGLVRCVEACVRLRRGDAARAGPTDLTGLRVAVQGCGAIGGAVAEALAARGVVLTIADVDATRAAAVAARTGAQVVPVDRLLTGDADVVAPCAIGAAVDVNVARELRAWALCGAANNVLADEETARVLAARGVAVVPDVVASAGAVIDGIGASVMGLADRTPLIDALGDTAHALLVEAARTGRTSHELAVERARTRIAQACAR